MVPLLTAVMIAAWFTISCAAPIYPTSYTMINDDEGSSEYIDSEVKIMAKVLASSNYNTSVEELTQDFLRAAGLQDIVRHTNSAKANNKCCSCSLRKPRCCGCIEIPDVPSTVPCWVQNAACDAAATACTAACTAGAGVCIPACEAARQVCRGRVCL